MKKLLMFIMAALCYAMSVQAFAGCYTAGSSAQNIGSFSSITVSEQALDFSFSSNFSCDGFVQLLDKNQIDATLVAANFELRSGSGAAIPYTLHTDTTRNHPFLLNQTVSFGNLVLLDLLNLFSNPDGALQLYLTSSLANVPAGEYSDNIAIFWEWDYCSGIGLLGICIGRDTGSEVIVVSLSLTVENTCQLHSQDAAFGSVTSVHEVHTTVLPAQVRCTKDLSFNIYVDGGDNLTNGMRQMTNGAETIGYEVFAPDGSTALGPLAANSLSASGTGNEDSLNFILRTSSTSLLPPAGMYTDNVRVVLNY